MKQGNLQQILAKAIDLQNKGEVQKASALFLQILKLQPKNVFALYSLAAIESNAGNNGIAIRYADKAVDANPNFAQARMARSVILYKLGELEKSLVEIDLAIKLQGDLAGAAAHKQVVEKAKNTGKIENYVPNSSTNPRNLRALELQNQEKYEEAEEIFLEVIEKNPDDFVALYSLGVISSRKGEPERAFEWLSKAAKVSPENPMIHYAMATSLQGMGMYEQALNSFDYALKLDPKYIEAYVNKATLLHSMSRQLDALKTLEAGLSVSPEEQKLLNNKGYILTEFKKHAVAADVFSYLLKLNPDYEYAKGLNMLARLHSCDWENYEENREEIIEGVRAGKRVCNPFAMMAITDNASDHFKCAEIFGQHRFPEAKEQMWRGEKYRHRKKRVAFISADFREHPVGYLLIGLIENLDKQKIESYGISVGIRDGSDLYRRYRNAFDHYLDCNDKTSRDVARLLRAMEIDVVIDLSGYTSGSRLDILSYRPCPAQATYLGFPGGLNLPYVDFLIADRVTVPENLSSFYREKLLYLPCCYLPRDTGVKPDPRTPIRSDYGLPENGAVFCSFNHDYKINPPMFAVWMDLLRNNPGSVLWLMKLNDDAHKNLSANADALGVDPARIIFANRVKRIEDHLARYRLVDVCLDTFPYNGHTTTSDALWAGMPVVTLIGQGFASRVASSLIADSSDKKLICESLSEYKEKANSLISGIDKTFKQADWFVDEKTFANHYSKILEAI